MKNIPNEVLNKPEVVSLDELRKAFKVFSGDLGIVGHDKEPPISIFGEPKRHGEYSLSLLPEDMSEQEVLRRLEQAKMVINGCMDKRQARLLYEHFRGNYQSEEIVVLFWGGGIVQGGTREGVEKRREAEATILTYFSQHTPNLERFYATNHDGRCGAIAYSLEVPAGKMPPGLGEKGSDKERLITKRLIADGIDLVPNEWKVADKVQAALVILNEKKQDISVELFDHQTVKPLRVKDLPKFAS